MVFLMRDSRLFSMQAVRVASLLLLLSSHTAHSADKGVEKTSPYPSSFITPKFPGDEDHIGTPPVSSDSSPKPPQPQFSGTPNIPVPPEGEKKASSSGGASANSTHIDLAKLSISELPPFPIDIPAVRDNIKNIHPRLLARLFFSPLVVSASVENGDLNLKTQHMYKQAYALWHQLISLLDYLEQVDTPLDLKTVGHSLASYLVLANLILQEDDATRLEQLTADRVFQDTLSHFGDSEYDSWNILRQDNECYRAVLLDNEQKLSCINPIITAFNSKRQRLIKTMKTYLPGDENYFETDFLTVFKDDNIYETGQKACRWDHNKALTIKKDKLPSLPFVVKVRMLPSMVLPKVLSVMFALPLRHEVIISDNPENILINHLTVMRLAYQSALVPFYTKNIETLDIISNVIALLAGQTPLLFPDTRHNKLNYSHMTDPNQLFSRLTLCQTYFKMVNMQGSTSVSEMLQIEPIIVQGIDQSKYATVHRLQSNQPLEQLLQEYDQKLQRHVHALLSGNPSS